jgi:hypothetical protein
MRRSGSLILAVILLIACSGCFWVRDRGDRGGQGNQDRGGYGEQDRGGHDGDRHDERRDSDHR